MRSLSGENNTGGIKSDKGSINSDEVRLSSANRQERVVTQMRDTLLRGLKNRLLQHLARFGPGSKLRVYLHRARGVRIGKGVWIGYDVILDTSRPDLITIEDDVAISMRAMVIAHFKESKGVKIERGAFIGPGAIVLPNLIVGHGAVVKAGSVVSQSIPPGTIVQGNPAIPVAKCEIPLYQDISLREFAKGVKPLVSRVSKTNEPLVSRIPSTNGSSEANSYQKN